MRADRWIQTVHTQAQKIAYMLSLPVLSIPDRKAHVLVASSTVFLTKSKKKKSPLERTRGQASRTAGGAVNDFRRSELVYKGNDQCVR